MDHVLFQWIMNGGLFSDHQNETTCHNFLLKMFHNNNDNCIVPAAINGGKCLCSWEAAIHTLE